MIANLKIIDSDKEEKPLVLNLNNFSHLSIGNHGERSYWVEIHLQHYKQDYIQSRPRNSKFQKEDCEEQLELMQEEITQSMLEYTKALRGL